MRDKESGFRKSHRVGDCEGDNSKVISRRELVMLQAIAILGGWLLMMGQHDRSASLFYYFRIEDLVPQDHSLRFIDRYVSFDAVREKLRASYSETGRRSIKTEVVLRMLRMG